MEQITIRGNIPEILRNDKKLYEGNLIHYFRAIFNDAQNLWNPYHNHRHMLHGLWLCYQACIFYEKELTPREIRNLLIAAPFHDFDHSGMMGNDDLNIERAMRGLSKNLAAEDKAHFNDICVIIRATEFPYRVSSENLSLSCKIIRDADLAQALDVVWIQQVILGLAKEWGKEPIEILQDQNNFLSNLKFVTEWAQKQFPRDAIAGKIVEAEELLKFLF